MWLRDYHLDGLRLDAVHALADHRALHILEELAAEVRAGGAAEPELVLVAESDANDPRLVTSRQAGGYGLTAQWSDDFHHAVHAAITGERQGYYCDFGAMAASPRRDRVFFHDGSWSAFRGRTHGRPVDILSVPAYRFVCFCRITTRSATARWATGSPPAARRTCSGRRRAGAHRALHADAVHGRGVGRGHPVAVLHRSHRPGLAGGRPGRQPSSPGTAGPADVPDPQDKGTFCAPSWTGPSPPASRTSMLAWYRALLALRRTRPELADPRLDRVPPTTTRTPLAADPPGPAPHRRQPGPTPAAPARWGGTGHRGTRRLLPRHHAGRRHRAGHAPPPASPSSRPAGPVGPRVAGDGLSRSTGLRPGRSARR